MAHKHWPKDHPYYDAAPVHEVTKKECDLQWRYYQHGHEGVPCVMELKPGNKVETCVLKERTKIEDHTEQLQREMQRYQEFIAKEERRMAALLDESKE